MAFMTALRKLAHPPTATPLACVSSGAAIGKRAVPKLSEAQIAFHRGLGQVETFSLAGKAKLLASAKKSPALA